MCWTIKHLAVVAIAASQFCVTSTAKQFVFTIQDDQLIVPLATPVSYYGKAAAIDSAPRIDSVSEINSTTTFQSAPIPTSTGVSAVPVIDIYGGGICPEGTESAATIGNKCQYGNAEGDRGSKGEGKCCFHLSQQVFLLSHPGGDPKAKYSLDSRTCCAGDNPTALIGDQCQYGNAVLSVAKDSVTKCCYDPTKGAFHVHLKEFKPLLAINANYHTSGQAPNGFCNLGYKIDVGGVRVYGNKIELDISVNVDCGPYNHTASTTLSIYLEHGWHDGGRLTYVLNPVIGPTVYVDLSSKINDDKSVDVRGHITGTGVLSHLDEGFTNTIADGSLKNYLALLPMC